MNPKFNNLETKEAEVAGVKLEVDLKVKSLNIIEFNIINLVRKD